MVPVSDAIHNERVKATTTLLNALAVAAVAIGVFTPLSRAFLPPDGQAAHGSSEARALASVAYFFLVALHCHGLALWQLKRLRETKP